MRQISAEWWIGLDDSYHNRVSDGSLVFWRPERTIWINIWNDAEGKSPRERLDCWTSDRHPDATDLYRTEDGPLLRFGYLLEEPEDEGGQRLGLYSFTVSPTSTVQMVCYFDLQEDLPWATSVSRSLSFRGPGDATTDEPVGTHGHLVMASNRVIGPERAPILLAYREPAANEQDSGWRFFHGDEDVAYATDPENVALCPLSSILDLDPSLRAVINSPAGSAWERETPGDVWRPTITRPDTDRDRPEWS